MRLRFWDKVILLAGAAAVLLVGTAVFIGCLRGDEDMSAEGAAAFLTAGRKTGSGAFLLLTLP